MDGEIFLEHYRLNSLEDRARTEIGRNGPAITYRGSDTRSGAPVAVTLLRVASVDPIAIEQFEEKARAAMRLDHSNIARTVAFERVSEQFVFVSEFPQGETVEQWVAAYGSMPPDAVLRVALQVVAALGAGSFQNLHHPAVQPSNIMIVPGKVAEGGWPSVKLMHFGLAGLKVAPGQPVQDWVVSDFASPEQLLRGTVDFRSEIYSLGATLCFLLTGVFYAAQPRAPQARRFARPLRNLIVKTLADDPNERPQDPVLFAEQLRGCLSKIEHQQELRQKFGIPVAPMKPVLKPLVHESLARPVGPIPPPLEQTGTWWFPRRSLAVAAMLLGVGIAAAFLLPEDVVTAALHHNKPIETIGVPVDSQNPDSAQADLPNHSSSPAIAEAQSSPAPSSQSEQAANQTLVSSASAENSFAMMQSSPVPNSGPVSSASPVPETNSSPVQIAANTLPPYSVQPAAPAPEIAAQPPTVSESGVSGPAQKDEQTRDSANETAKENSPASDVSSEKRNKALTSKNNARKFPITSKGTRGSNADGQLHPGQSRYARRGMVRGRVVGVTPAGNLVLRLPSGRIVFVHPRGMENETSNDLMPQRRVIIQRPPGMAPPLEPFRLDPYGD